MTPTPLSPIIVNIAIAAIRNFYIYMLHMQKLPRSPLSPIIVDVVKIRKSDRSYALVKLFLDLSSDPGGAPGGWGQKNLTGALLSGDLQFFTTFLLPLSGYTL